MKSKLTKQQKGFTIIEVLIVLAIAGLIMLIVFLAVPALQRNSRNTQRKNDVSAILSAVSEFTNNNNGQLPNAWNTEGPGVQKDDGSVTDVKLGYYDGSSEEVVTLNAVASGGTTNAGDPEQVQIVTKAKCDGTDAVQGSSRGVVILYTVESGSGSTPQCVEG